MFGKNIQTKRIDNPDNHLLVKEIFETIQGEGPFAGRPCTFVRLGGCNLKCLFCDTDFDVTTSRYTSIPYIVKECIGYGHNLVVLTGGEPMLQDIVPLIIALRAEGIAVQIETAGSVWPLGLTQDVLFGDGIVDDYPCTVVVSPKTHIICAEALKHASAFKYLIRATDTFAVDGTPVCNTQVLEGARTSLALKPRHLKNSDVYLQPVEEYISQDPVKGLLVDRSATDANIAKAVALCMEHGFTLSLQIHKLLGLP